MVIAHFMLISLIGGAILGIGLRVWDELVERHKTKQMLKLMSKDEEKTRQD